MDLSGLSDDQLSQMAAQLQQLPPPQQVAPTQPQQAPLPGPDLSGLSDDQLQQMAQAAQGGAAASSLTIRPAPPANNAAAAAVSGAIDGVPVVGPYLLGGMQRLSAFERSMDAGTSYADELANVQAADAGRQADHPYATAAGGVGGGVLGTAPLVAAAPAAFGIGSGSLAARMLAGAGSGATLGAADGAARADGTAAQRGMQALKGAAVGGGLGLAGPAVGDAVGGLLGRVAGQSVQEAPGVPKSARDYLVERLKADDPAQVLQNMRGLGDQAMLADYGPSLRGIAQGLSTKPGPAQQPIMQALTDRNLGTNARLGAVADAQFGPAQSPLGYSAGLFDQVRPLAQQRAQMLDAAPPVDISSVVDHIDDAIGRTAPNSPQRAALQDAKGYLTVTRPAQIPQLESEIGATPAPVPGGTFPIDDATQLHSAKQALDNAIDYDAKGLQVPNSAVNGANNSYKSIRAKLNDAMRAQIPGYADNQDATSALMRQQAAVREGTQDLRAGAAAQRPDDYAAMFGALPPLEQDARRVGMRAAMDQQLGTKANDLQALKTLTQGDNGWNAQNLGTAFGQDQAAALNRVVDAESKFRETYNKVTQNSETARNTAAAKGLQDAEYDPFQIGHVHNLTMEGIAATAAKQPINAVLRMLQRPVDNTARDMGLARAVTATGADRDALLAQMLRARAAEDGNSLLAAGPARAVATAGALASPAVSALLLRRGAREAR